MEERQPPQQTVQKQLDVHWQKMNIYISLTSYRKFNSKWITDLNGKHLTIMCLKENTEGNWEDIVLGKELLDLIPKAVSLLKMEKLGSTNI